VVLKRLIHGGQYLICDDFNLYCHEMMNEIMVGDGLIENELDHKRRQLVIKHILNMQVQLKKIDGILLGGVGEFLRIICLMNIHHFLI
jgi:hypothetical protein